MGGGKLSGRKGSRGLLQLLLSCTQRLRPSMRPQNDALRLSGRIWNSPALSPLHGTSCDHRVFFQTQKGKHRHGFRHRARPRHLWESGWSGQWGAREAFEVGDKMHLKAGVHRVGWNGGSGQGAAAGSSH